MQESREPNQGIEENKNAKAEKEEALGTSFPNKEKHGTADGQGGENTPKPLSKRK